jgi:hypothetical protein
MQLAYPLGPNPALPGMRAGSTMTSDVIRTAIAAVPIPFGVLCEYTAGGLVQPLQTTETGGGFAPNFAGVSFYDALQVEQPYVPYQVPPTAGPGPIAAAYPKGFPVPIMRRGSIWCLFDGDLSAITAYPINGPFNVWHSSDGTHLQGVLTGRAVNGAAGQEVDLLPIANFKTDDPEGYAGQYTSAFGSTFGVGPLAVNLF